MKKAWMVAGLQLVVGLFLLASVVGIRVLTAPGESVVSEVDELERLQETLAKTASSAEAANASMASSRTEPSAQHRDSADGGGADPSGMVACEISGGRQFMSGSDCAMRGGRATKI